MKLSNITDLTNETIATVEVIPAEYGRTYRNYICITCASGNKIILCGDIPYDPNPRLQDMQKASSFFTEADLAAKRSKDERLIAERLEKANRDKLWQLRQLEKELKDAGVIE